LNRKKLAAILTTLLLIQLSAIKTLTAEPRVERYAVICGISDYETINDLEYSDDDARSLRDALQEISWSHITLLIDQQASKNGIRNAINALTGIVDADDIVLFYFAGHGTYGADLSPMDEDDAMDEYICPWDASSGYTSNIRDDELEAWLDNLPCRKVVILDTCFSGGFIREDEMTPRTVSDKPRMNLKDTFAKDLDKAGYVVLTACRDDELSYESSNLGHGIFTYFIFQGITCPTLPADADLDRWVTAEEEYYYAGLRTTTYNPLQHPQLHDFDPANPVRLGFYRIVGGDVKPPDLIKATPVVSRPLIISLLVLTATAIITRKN
jgi:hypothetical protein